MNTQPKADRIEQVAFGFMAAKVLFSALELELFTELAKGPLNAEDVRIRFGLHRRSVRDFLDALVALGLPERNEEAYFNIPDTDFYLDRSKPTYCGSIFEMWDARGYGFWASLTEALQTGKPQNEIKGGEDLFTATLRKSGQVTFVPPINDRPQYVVRHRNRAAVLVAPTQDLCRHRNR